VLAEGGAKEDLAGLRPVRAMRPMPFGGSGRWPAVREQFGSWKLNRMGHWTCWVIRYWDEVIADGDLRLAAE
jgi:hypothetical protein